MNGPRKLDPLTKQPLEEVLEDRPTPVRKSPSVVPKLRLTNYSWSDTATMVFVYVEHDLWTEAATVNVDKRSDTNLSVNILLSDHKTYELLLSPLKAPIDNVTTKKSHKRLTIKLRKKLQPTISDTAWSELLASKLVEESII